MSMKFYVINGTELNTDVKRHLISIFIKLCNISTSRFRFENYHHSFRRHLSSLKRKSVVQVTSHFR